MLGIFVFMHPLFTTTATRYSFYVRYSKRYCKLIQTYRMDEQKKALISRMITEGKTRHVTRGELISEGMDTVGFEELYASALVTLGAKEPKEPVHQISALQATGEVPLHAHVTHTSFFAYIVRLGKFVLGIAIIALVAFYMVQTVLPVLKTKTIESTSTGEAEQMHNTQGVNPLGATDILLQSKVSVLVNAANFYVGRMSFFDGVCKDIGVLQPVLCTESPTGFAIFVGQANGSYYCTDKAGFSGMVAKKPRINGLCK